MNFKERIFKLMGPFEKLQDSNKNQTDEGTLERYMQAYGIDVDTNIIPLIENLVQNTSDSERMLARFLDLRETERGVTPLFFTHTGPNTASLNRWMRRRVLQHIEKITAIRGTKQGFELLFRLIDRSIITFEIREEYFENRFDVARFDIDRFDTSLCSQCPRYSIIITGVNGVTDYFIRCAATIIKFNQPVDVTLGVVTYNGVSIWQGLPVSLDDTGGALWDAEGQSFTVEQL